MPAGRASLVLLFALSLSSAPARAASPCSADTFSIDSAALAVAVCPPATAPHLGGKVTLTETLSVKGQPPLTRDFTLELLADSDSSRGIDDVPLQKLGIEKTLHLTLAYKAGAVRLEHALLVPGAIALK